MTRSWKDAKAAKAEHDGSSGRDVETARAVARTRTQAYVLGFRLAQLRKEVGISQAEIAERMGVSQPRVSQLENGEVGQMEVDTLSRYVTALGGKLKLVADFEDHGITVTAPEIDRERLAI
ncbi:transcriptional regulator, XRE family [Alloactinosynnema sp. L-07]|uniref:helix-turn-helix domain-containing protein n=1 Tax=Alloactinosynnema sp. L-07 TaxID=1653480 RepID=UPI00065EFD5A|nr:XRE family transcriptional regulator [Alloactinosynnema sp. L-07]CRK61579.1 transcriptional regulator, XRE family [Alloactinosynnema sp. L-07]